MSFRLLDSFGFFLKVLAALVSLALIQVFLDGVVFCSNCQLQETAKISSSMNQQQSQQLYKPRCFPLPLIRLLSTERQRDWWNATYSLIHTQAA